MAFFAGDTDNASAGRQATLTIGKATPLVGVSETGGTLGFSTVPTTINVAGVESKPASSLESIAPTLIYVGCDANGAAHTWVLPADTKFHVKATFYQQDSSTDVCVFMSRQRMKTAIPVTKAARSSKSRHSVENSLLLAPFVDLGRLQRGWGGSLLGAFSPLLAPGMVPSRPIGE